MSNNHNHYNKNPLELITTDIFDLITVNGRISKKLVEKVIIPEIDRYYASLQEITKLKKALHVANESLEKIEKECKSVIMNQEHDTYASVTARKAQKQIKKIMEG